MIYTDASDAAVAVLRPYVVLRFATYIKSFGYFTLLCFRGSIMINGIPSACPYPVMG
jgi:hypothetical protein